jgi:polyhydroxybutyrate depolymerase
MANRHLQKLTLALFFALTQVGFNVHAQSLNPNQTVPRYLPYTMEWTISGITRKALVYLPPSAKTESTPVIFAFHGHGGTMLNMYNTRGFDKFWPEAIFICPQGLNTPGMLTDPEGKRTGWQMNNDQTNTDLQFFDAILSTLQKDYKIDQKRIFVTGHSNGGGFTYLLLATRGDLFAAIAPTATAARTLTLNLKPKPVLHLMGEADPLVKPIWQKQTYNLMLKLNQCETSGKKIDDFTTFYASKTGNPVVLFIHPDGHNYPAAANESIISFFKKFGNN